MVVVPRLTFSSDFPYLSIANIYTVSCWRLQMKQAVEELLATHHTETVVKNKLVDSVLQKDMAFSGTTCCILNSLHFVHLATTNSLLVLLGGQFSELIQFVYSKFNVIASNVKLPAKQRAGFLDKYGVGPNFPSCYALVKLERKTCQLTGLIGPFYFLGVDVCFWSKKFGISKEAHVISILDHWGQLYITLIIDYLVR